MIRLTLAALALCVSTTLHAQLTRADSSLIVRILLAEDRRDSSDPAIGEGMQHADARIRTIAQRAQGRIRDPRFVARTALPALPAPPAYPDPAWRLRLRALTPQSPCSALHAALADSAWPVAFRAATIAADPRRACTTDPELAAKFRAWIDATPPATPSREPGRPSWHLAAYGIRAFARHDTAGARERIARLSRHTQWQVRMYTVGAALTIGDTNTIRRLAGDRDDNVRETAISALSSLTRHASDAIYLAALRSNGAPAVRAAARALRDSTKPLEPNVRDELETALRLWTGRQDASAHDTRVAILAALGRPATDDQPPPISVSAPPHLAALALGKEVRLVVTMSRASGGGTFVVRLRGDVAPMMAARILQLAENKYYDGLSWHRVEHDFVIQGGSPGANEYVGYKAFLRDELGTVPHVRGTVGMSTRGHDTGDAQWFINLRDNVRLNPDYTVFGEVVSGIEVVDGILEGDVIESVRTAR